MLKKLKSEKGISLLEVLFSAFIAIVSVFSVMMVYPKMKVLSQVSEHKMAAVHAAQSIAETYRRAGFENVFPGSVTTAVTLSEGKNLSSSADDVLAEVTTTVSDVSSNGFVIGRAGVIEVTWVAHNWSDPGGAPEILKEVVNFVVFDNARPDTSGGGYSDPSQTTILCHVASTPPQTITVGNPAVAGHLAHGDYLGPCVEEEEEE